jgi:hypothetical protein
VEGNGRRALPLFAGLRGGATRPSTPHLEQARRSLGGPYSDDVDAAMIGRFVRAEPHEGVVLHADASTVDVMVSAGVVRRVERSRVVALDDVELSPLRRRMAGDVRRFAAMPAGRRARFATEGGGEDEGLLIEKCRYGALLALDDGRVVALGFSRMIATVAPG